MKKLSLGIIGCGVIGKMHMQGAAALPEHIDLVAVADLREDAARAAAEQFHVRACHPSAEALLADPNVEAVVLATPLNARSELPIKALLAGKHVLIEKPLAANVAAARRILAVRGDRVVAGCSSRNRFYQSARAAEEIIRSGALGRIRVVRCRAAKPAGAPPQKTPPPWRVNKTLNGGGILVNWGVYDLDYLLGVMGWSLKPRTVLAQTWEVPPRFSAYVAPGSDAETHYAALIRCDGGAVITLERGEFMTTTLDEAWQIVGSDASLRLMMTPEKSKKLWLDEARRGTSSRVAWEGDESYDTQPSDLLKDFATAIREGRPPTTSLEQAIVIQEITDAIYASAESGNAVSIE